jgi:ribose transport system substrate-binding protein
MYIDVSTPCTEGESMRKSLVAAVLTAAALALTSCAMPADDPNFNSGGAEGVIDADVASANAADQAALEGALATPTSIGVDAPLPAVPAAGATIVSLTGGSEYEGVFETALADAAGVLGWTVESVTVDSADPTAVAAAFDDAVAKKAGGIHITGGDVDALAESLPAAATAGIPVICTGCSADPIAGVTDASINGTEQNILWGDVLASYVVTSQQAGEDAGVQVFALPGGAMSDFNLEFETSLLDQCRNCSATESVVDPTLLDLTDPASVSAFVVGEMSTSLGSWALLDSGSLSGGVADALATDPTLLSPVILMGRGASAADIEALKALGGAVAPAASAGASPEASAAASPEGSAAPSGSAAADAVVAEGRTPEEAAALQAWIGIPQPLMAWRVIDQFARVIGGGEPATGLLPSQLLTGANAADAVVDENGNYIGIADYQDQFKALWGVK